MRTHRLTFPLLLFGFVLLAQADTKPGVAPKGPLSPKEEMATFKIAKGFKVELVASEPDVVDPVAMAFDEDGRLFVAEMIGYPNGGVATGNITSGRIRMLEDPDGKGVYTKSSIFADGLRLPASVMPYKGGLLVSNAPDLVFFEGPDAKGKSKGKRVLYTGFDLSNSEQLLNGLQWGLDNWVYGCCGHAGGTITSAEKPDAPKVVLRGRGIRFRPDVPGSLEPMSGGGQFGLAADDEQNWFTATNSQHLRQIVLPDHYLRRNPYLTVPAVTLDIPDHGAACKVFRISPFEAWRVERTTMRAGAPDSKRFPSTELEPGGYITSGCSPAIYTAGLFPKKYYGNSFMCEPANNLIHRDVLKRKEPNKFAFTASRTDDETDCEFLASSDIWFRPVALTLGPDGAIYVADFYREIIETPLSLTDDIKKKYNLESRGRGRIWRIVPDDFRQPAKPALSKATTPDLVKHLTSDNSWHRLTAQRLLVERQDKAAVEALRKLAQSANEPLTQPSNEPLGQLHALWTLHGLNALDDSLIEFGLERSWSIVRIQALRLAEDRLAVSKPLRQSVVRMARDSQLTYPQYRLQLAFTLGAADGPDVTRALAKMAEENGDNPWMQTALLSSVGKSGPTLLELLVKNTKNADATRIAAFLRRLAGVIGAGGNEADLAKALGLLGEAKATDTWPSAIIEGIGQGMQSAGRPLSKVRDDPSPALKDGVAKALPFFERAAASAQDSQRDLAERTAAVRMLGSGPFTVAVGPLGKLLSPVHPAEVQLAAVRSLAGHDNAKVASMLLAGWSSYSPAVRREATEAMLARVDRLQLLLDAVEQKKIPAAQLEASRVELLRKHPNMAVRDRVAKLFGNQAASDRQKIVDEYQAALKLKGDAARGKMAFKKTCATCHRLENEGFEVGADLLAALKTKTPDALLIDILDPSREVDPRFLNYVVSTKDGRILTGVIAVESPASITLRRAEKSEDTILRSQIDEIQATAKSLMPEELEKQLSKQDLADVIAYLLSVVGK
jgi:putative membrane-bound dehydrogenase-like protein